MFSAATISRASACLLSPPLPSCHRPPLSLPPVTNHGIPVSVMEGMLDVAREFFHLPESERLKCCSDDPDKVIRLSTSFNVPAERVSNWRDVLRLHCYTLESFVDQWPPNPPVFSEVVGTYSTEARALALRLLEAISESLGLELGHMVNAMGQHTQQMALNYYPPSHSHFTIQYSLIQILPNLSQSVRLLVVMSARL